MYFLLKIITVVYCLICLPLSLLLISDVGLPLKVLVIGFDLLAIVFIKVSFFNKKKVKTIEAQKQEVKDIIKNSIEFKVEVETKRQPQKIDYSYSKVRKLTPNFTVLDFETTGLSAEEDCIIQIGAVKYRDFKKIDEFVMYVNPLIPIPDYITKINGITEEDVVGAPTIDKVLPQLVEFLGDDVIIAHNASFDMKFLLANIKRNSIESRKFKVIDTLSLARKYIDFTKNHKLETMKSFLKLNHLSSHDALHDCFVTAELYKYCYEESNKVTQ